jgi:VIT1/CCC1 family predicted Fe2+/Mn2+ transporter
VLTVISISAAEVARPVRFLNFLLGASLAAVPFVFDADLMTAMVSVVAGIALGALSIRRGALRDRYGNWDRFIV